MALLEVEGLRTHFATDEGEVRAVDGVDLAVDRGQILCVVGESGCGKSVMARSIMQLVEPPGRIVGGRILLRRRPEDRDDVLDLAALGKRSEAMRQVRGRGIGMVFQEPAASLSPMYTIGNQLIETVVLHLQVGAAEAEERAVAALRRVGIPRPEDCLNAYPFELSGGMCQRAMIALALACEPQLLIADEPTTALDVTTQARILDLITDLRDQTGMAILFITHDLGVVAEVADAVAVMYLGRVVEQGTVEQIFYDPKHPYTHALLRSIPTLGSGRNGRLATIRGVVPHPRARPSGCAFHDRCDSVIPGRCDVIDPPNTRFAEGRCVRCLLYGEAQDFAPAMSEEM